MKKQLTMTAKNKAFWAKPKAEQRVAVAKDVIKQLSLGFMVAEEGTYFGISGLQNEIEKPSEKLDKVFATIKKEEATCNVCGVGGCFVSLVNLGNNAKTKTFFGNSISDYDSIDDDDMRKLLRKVFSPNQLTLIECAFEKTLSMKDDKDKSEDFELREKAADFGRQFYDETDRLVGIMQNIIDNKGTFKP